MFHLIIDGHAMRDGDGQRKVMSLFRAEVIDRLALHKMPVALVTVTPVKA